MENLKTMDEEIKIENNYPVGMHPPINDYKYPEDIEEWKHCPKCGFQPRVWEFDNGRSTFCGCSNSTYDHFSVRATPIGDIVRKTRGSLVGYDSDELKKNWNKYCDNNLTKTLQL